LFIFLEFFFLIIITTTIDPHSIPQPNENSHFVE